MLPRLFTARFLPCLLPAVWGLVSTAVAVEMTPAQRTFFENKIRPVLVKHCYECHATDAKKVGGKLLLDSPSEMIAGGESGPALIPGEPDRSLIIQALKHEGLEMPPKTKLRESVVEDFIHWVRLGAPDPRDEDPESSAGTVETLSSDLWSLQPIVDPALPKVSDSVWVRDPVDAFVMARLEKEKLKPAADAERAVLVRRLSFDLTGLPPTEEQIAAAAKPDFSIERLVDELLASPHFGERWGRHWLDVARFGESNGNDGLSRNPSFPHAWRYRDYVIDAFNNDTPYDRFITEQIAGDLLEAETAEQRDRQLIATGFLAIGAKPAKAMNDNFEMDVVADQIAVVGSGIMGLSVGCARCHDHKTDPIPTRDYYALAGIFKSSETLWGAAARQSLTAPQTALHELKAAPPMGPRAEIEEVILKHPPRREPSKPAFTHEPDQPLAMGVRENKKIENCRVNIAGESKKLGPEVPRGFVGVCGEWAESLKPGARQSGRLELARWLTDPRHPLTARVMVNRVWLHLMGGGLVGTPDDFGSHGDKPSHPGLLDHLATRFVRRGWSVKQLIRGIVLSRTYQLGSDNTDDDLTQTAEARRALFGQHARRRLDAESLRDAMLAASGELDRQPGVGSLIQARDVLVNELPPLHVPSSHRSVYLPMLRNSLPPELTPFNLPDGTTVTGKRDASTLATQALYLLNHPFVVGQSNRFAQRIKQVSPNERERVRAAYRRAFGRGPTETETSRALDFVHETDLMLVSSANDDPSLSDAWAAFCQALLVSNELRYVD